MQSYAGFGSIFRYCPKCGTAAMHFIGGKLLRCHACGFEFYLNVAAAVAALILDEQGRLLIVVRGKEPGRGMWDLPGGFVDPGESIEDSLRREVREEVGLEIASMRYVGSHPNVYEYMGIRYSTVDVGFACEVQEASGAAPRESDIAEVLWKARRQIDPRKFAFPSLARLVQEHVPGISMS